jgi:hypothetical protein
MVNRQTKTVGRGLALLGAAIIALAACATLPPTANLPERHPEELDKGRAVCTDCHDAQGEITYANYNHRNDCHAAKLELKPSIRQQSESYREMPHRGDYISRHRIDARVDPTSCFRCHGSPKTSTSCAPCHG